MVSGGKGSLKRLFFSFCLKDIFDRFITVLKSFLIVHSMHDIRLDDIL